MEKLGWKILAIVFMVLFILETAYVSFGVMLVLGEEKMTKECYYDVCSEYPDAFLEDGVCYCYDYDLMGEPVVVETQVLD